MNALDIIIFITLTFFVYRGAQNGLIGELLGMTGWLLAGLLALRFGGWAAHRINGYLHLSATAADLLGFVAMLLAVRILFQLTLVGIKKTVDGKTHDAMNKLLGAVIGFVKGAFLVSIFVLAISYMPLGEKVKDYQNRSALFPHMKKFAQSLLYHVVHFVPQTQPQPAEPLKSSTKKPI